jgi:hypothetical protein
MHFKRKRSGKDRQRLGHATEGRRSLRKNRKKALENQIKEVTRV